MSTPDLFILPARACLSVAIVLCAYLLACGINAIIERVFHLPRKPKGPRV